MIPLADLAAIIGVALACALVVGALGAVALRFARRAPLFVQVGIVVLTGMLSVVSGMIAVAQAMFLSPHDLQVGMWVAGAATLASLGVAVILGRAFTRQSGQLLRLTEQLGEGRPVSGTTGHGASSELSALEAELARTSLRLQAAREEVEALEASRRELIAWISHDLRTPLAGLRAMAEALEDGMAEDPHRFHRQMRSQVDHLSDLVDDLFELSKIQSGRLVLSLESVSLYDLVSDAVAELHPLARARSISIRESPRPDLVVRGDARELSRVVGNLLMNAIEHSPPDSEIRVMTSLDDDDRAMLSVIDAGGGIPEDELSKVFLAGWRATVSRTPEQLWGRSANAGLGLAIARGIVEAHDGEIDVRNEGDGCRFDVRLPVAAAA
ncbi:HAMP domain-containing histidine kinase [Microbacterium sp. HD4P20]|uniref:sensor histidine kinase n=1 Tax=Microbacterium sp. HD4P20 TaxID=2864874 RepID=UPI001C640D47|nr:HAMP domain-containing sensor histidine kinase [Microbacterium sp. HD4P20]MCP2637632.1 HAMP domain-containing histidine kinase [Microbacterium sp. HD4P20]